MYDFRTNNLIQHSKRTGQLRIGWLDKKNYCKWNLVIE